MILASFDEDLSALVGTNGIIPMFAICVSFCLITQSDMLEILLLLFAREIDGEALFTHFIRNGLQHPSAEDTKSLSHVWVQIDASSRLTI